MSEHNLFREMFPLGVAGGLDPADEQRLERHLAACADCSAEFERWRDLAGALRRLPTPQVAAGLIERTRAKVEAQFAAESERRWNRGVLIFLVMFAWTLTLASWPVARLLSGGLLAWLDPAFGRTWLGLAGYTAMVWVSGAVAAATLALRRRLERRTV
jgi:anti-sigma factor RsiW